MMPTFFVTSFKNGTNLFKFSVILSDFYICEIYLKTQGADMLKKSHW